MESEQVGADSDGEPTTMEEHLDKCCEYYMSIGVPYDVFWHGDFCSFKYYESVYLQKRKIKNEEMWMQGIYFYSAIATALSNSFRDKNSKPHDYLMKPIDFFPKTEEEKKHEAEQMRQQVIANLSHWKETWENHHGSRNS